VSFELSEALIDEILFAMEDQNSLFVLDSLEGLLVSMDDDAVVTEADASVLEKRYISLPEWDSSEGFHLMEHFAAGLKNTPVRRRLTDALERGKGVFRAFKDVLGEHPEVEQLWFAFKEKEMRQRVIDWYNALREEWGLERVGPEPEETVDLIMEDFKFRRAATGDKDAIIELHRLCNANSVSAPPLPAKPALVLLAETGRGEVIACLIAEKLPGSGGGNELRISILEVKPEYRGLGVGKALLSQAVNEAQQIQPWNLLSIDLPTEFEGFSRALLRESFKPQSTRYVCSAKED
jgi:GNAT superfamily N-acetyltransferase